MIKCCALFNFCSEAEDAHTVVISFHSVCVLACVCDHSYDFCESCVLSKEAVWSNQLSQDTRQGFTSTGPALVFSLWQITPSLPDSLSPPAHDIWFHPHHNLLRTKVIPDRFLHNVHPSLSVHLDSCLSPSSLFTPWHCGHIHRCLKALQDLGFTWCYSGRALAEGIVGNTQRSSEHQQFC